MRSILDEGDCELSLQTTMEMALQKMWTVMILIRL